MNDSQTRCRRNNEGPDKAIWRRTSSRVDNPSAKERARFIAVSSICSRCVSKPLKVHPLLLLALLLALAPSRIADRCLAKLLRLLRRPHLGRRPQSSRPRSRLETSSTTRLGELLVGLPGAGVGSGRRRRTRWRSGRVRRGDGEAGERDRGRREGHGVGGAAEEWKSHLGDTSRCERWETEKVLEVERQVHPEKAGSRYPLASASSSLDGETRIGERKS